MADLSPAGYSPDDLIAGIMVALSESGIEISDEPHREQAFLAASSLLLALGVVPVVDPADSSRAAGVVRELMLAEQVKTTTRPRRLL